MNMIRKTVTITAAMDRWIKKQIALGRYGNDSEYVRDLIRRDQDYQTRLATLRKAIHDGRESGLTDDRAGGVIAEGQRRQPGLAEGRLTESFFEELPPEELDAWDQ